MPSKNLSQTYWLKAAHVDKPTGARCLARLSQVLSTGLLGCNHRVGRARALSELRTPPPGPAGGRQSHAADQAPEQLVDADSWDTGSCVSSHVSSPPPCPSLAVCGALQANLGLGGYFLVRTWRIFQHQSPGISL